MPECDRCGATHATVERTLDDGYLCPSCQEHKKAQAASRELGQAALSEYRD
jgi:anaerobic ribonucleoside-triphosphate reductase